MADALRDMFDRTPAHIKDNMNVREGEASSMKSFPLSLAFTRYTRPPTREAAKRRSLLDPVLLRPIGRVWKKEYRTLLP